MEKKDKSRTNNKKKPLNKKWKRPVKIILLLMMMGMVFILIYAGIVLSKDYSIEGLAQDVDMNSIVYDREGNEIRSLYSVENREVIKLNTLPDHLKNAFIYTEDRRFRSHHGVDPQGILRALWVDIRTLSLAE